MEGKENRYAVANLIAWFEDAILKYEPSKDDDRYQTSLYLGQCAKREYQRACGHYREADDDKRAQMDEDSDAFWSGKSALSAARGE